MKKLKCLILLIFPFLLVACGPPSIFGIPQDQWDQLNQQQRSKVIEGYNQRTKTEAQVAPIYALADALKAKNSTAKADKPAADPFPDHNPMMDPDPEIDKAFQPPGMFADDLKGL
ncbi:MAG: hypothetical protein RJA83_138 [Pseudomonadota bacterium]|jgi:hypothetical protein